MKHQPDHEECADAEQQYDNNRPVRPAEFIDGFSSCFLFFTQQMLMHLMVHFVQDAIKLAVVSHLLESL